MLKRLINVAVVRAAACWLISLYVRFAHASGRWQMRNREIPDAFWRRDEPFILALWHGRLLMMTYCWQRGKPIDFLISFHRDGDMVARTIGHFGLGSIRGSSKIGGATALKAMVKDLRQGTSVGIAPDGPTGPRMRASEGVVSVARLSGVPILPATCAASRRIVLGSWDRFIIPLPFSRGIFLWGDPIHVPRDADGDLVQETILQLENTLNKLTDEADHALGQEPILPASLTDVR